MHQLNVSGRVWSWIKDRFQKKTGTNTLRCDKMLAASSEKELLAAIAFLRDGDELALALPLHRVADLADVLPETAQEIDVSVAAGSS